MSYTVSQLIIDCQTKVDDFYVPNPTQWLSFINEGRRKLFEDSLCFPYQITLSSQANIINTPQPADLYAIRDIRFCDSSGNWTSGEGLLPVSKKEWEMLGFNTTSTTLQKYYEEARVLNFWPMLSAGAYQDTTQNALNATSGIGDPTLMLVIGTVGLPAIGRCLIDSEVIGWSGLNADGFTLMNVTRGLEGTTPATHLVGATFINRDIRITYYQMPADLTTNSQTIETVFEMYKEALKYYACWQAKIKDTDDVQATGADRQASMFFQLYTTEHDKFIRWIQGREDESYVIRRLN